MTIQQVAAESNVSESSVRNWIRGRQFQGITLVATKIGGRIYVDRGDYERFVELTTIPISVRKEIIESRILSKMPRSIRTDHKEAMAKIAERRGAKQGK